MIEDLLEVVHDLLVSVLGPLAGLLVQAALGDGLVPQPHLVRGEGVRSGVRSGARGGRGEEWGERREGRGVG